MEEHLKEMATFQGDSRREAKPQLNAQYRDLVANILKKGGNPSRGLLLLRCAMLIIVTLVAMPAMTCFCEVKAESLLQWPCPRCLFRVGINLIYFTIMYHLRFDLHRFN